MSAQFFFRAVNERQTFQVYVLHIIRPFTGFSFQNRRILLPPLIDVFLLSLCKIVSLIQCDAETVSGC